MKALTKRRKMVGGMDRANPAVQDWRKRCKAQVKWIGESGYTTERHRRMANLSDTIVQLDVQAPWTKVPYLISKAFINPWART
jgi:hypothetical protein